MALVQTIEREHEVVYLPKNLNIEEEINKNPPFVKRYHKNPDKVIERTAVILGQLFQRMIFNKDFDQSIEDGYISLNAQILEELVEDYRAILRWAIKREIVETDNHYTPGRRSKGYRFSSKYWRESRKHYIYDQTLIGNLRKGRIDEETSNKFPFLYKCLEEIEIDFGAAWGKMHELYTEEMQLLQNMDMELEKYQELHAKIESKFYSRIAAIESLNDKRLYFKQDDNVGRLHTSITGLKREAREFLSWKGEKLVAVDISNAQPYFSLCLLREEIFETLDIPALLSHYNPNLSIIMFRRFRQMLGTYIDRLETYMEVVAAGQLYEFMSKQLGIERHEAKLLIFNIFFSIPSWKFKGKDEFIELFPEVWEIFTWVNTGFEKTKKQGRKTGEQSNALAMVLQRVESLLILEHIVPKIISDAPGLPIWTVHDSVMTIKGQEEVVAQIIKDEAGKLIGLPPAVKYE